MKNRITNNRGFTLIELVMVIVILGILSAVAIPRFMDLKSSAQKSVRDGVTGALAGQISMSHANFLISGADYTATLIASSINTSGIDNFKATSSTAIEGTIGDTPYTWDYEERDGTVAARITGVSP